jgi:hypothetical protein
MNFQKIAYWVATGLLCAMMLMSVGMYFFNYEEVAQVFEATGYPTYVIYPLAVAKLLAVGVILSNQWKLLKEWAYAGLFFDFVLAFFAHYMIGDGEGGGAVVATILLLVSYFLGKKVRP